MHSHIGDHRQATGPTARRNRQPPRNAASTSPGQTGLPNLGRLLRLNHRWKTHGRWKVLQLIVGVWLWRSPHGFHYLVDGTGTTALGRL